MAFLNTVLSYQALRAGLQICEVYETQGFN